MTPVTLDQPIEIPDALSLVPLREAVVLPYSVSTLLVGQQRSVHAIEEVRSTPLRLRELARRRDPRRAHASGRGEGRVVT